MTLSPTRLLPPGDPYAVETYQDERNDLMYWLATRITDLLRLPMFGLPVNEEPFIVQLIWLRPVFIDFELIGFADLVVIYASDNPQTHRRAAAFIIDFEIAYTADLIQRLRLYDIALMHHSPEVQLVVVTADPDSADLATLPQQGFGVLDLNDMNTVGDYDTPISLLVDAYPPVIKLAWSQVLPVVEESSSEALTDQLGGEAD